MALNGIPIPDTQEIGDSLPFLNSALTTLDTRTSTGPLSLTGNISAVAGTFTASVSAPAVRGMHYGNGANLTNLAATSITDGTLSYLRLPAATASLIGAVKIGTGLSVDINGLLTLVAPTGGALGGVKAGSNITIAADGTISGVNSYTLPNATTSTLGGVIVGSGLNVTSGTVSLAAPTGGALGGVKAGSNITIGVDGTISGVNSYTLSAANSTGLGGVKIDGTFMTINDEGSIKSPLDLGYNSTLWAESLSGNYWTSVAMSSDGTHRAALNYGGYLYVSNNGGLSWTAKLTDAARNWYKVSMSSTGQKMVAVANADYIFVSLDYGTTWTARYINSYAYRSVAVSPDGSRAVVTVSGSTKILRSFATDFDTWQEVTIGVLGLSWRSAALSNNGLYKTAVANGDYIYRSINSGDSWSPVTAAGARTWNVVTMSSDGRYQYAAAGTLGTTACIYRSTDFGASWLILSNSPAGVTDIVTNNSGATVYASTAITATPGTGLIYRSTDYGANWTVFNVNTNIASYTVRDWKGIATNFSDGSKLMTAVYSAPVLIYPAPRWTTTFGLSTNALEAASITASLGAFTSLSSTTGSFTVSVDAPIVTGVHYGDGSNITNLAAANITGTLAAARLPVAGTTAAAVGGVYQGNNITIAADGKISGVNSYVLPNATTSVLGGVIIGAGLSVASGTVTLAAPTGGALGGVKAGSNITIAADGTINGLNAYSLPAATTLALGGIIVGSGLSVTNGNVSLVAASQSVRGGVRVDNTSITISNNDVISVNPASFTNINANSLNTTVANPVISTSFTPVLADKNSVIVLTVDSGESYPFRIPTDAEVNFPIGTQFTIVQGGIIPITLIPTNTTTVNLRTLGPSRNRTTGQNAVATLLKLAANTWLAGGNLI